MFELNLQFFYSRVASGIEQQSATWIFTYTIVDVTRFMAKSIIKVTKIIIKSL